MKKILQTTILVTILSFSVNAQTNVSGGIFANTTWTTANSPYIVTSTVVVYPGLVLTIQPGVTVKFDNGQQLEIRQSQLISTGTSGSPITFTSNSNSPTQGIYSGIYLNGVTVAHTFDYCNFSYADFGIRTNSSPNLSVTNSNFVYNNTGIFSGASANISDCLFRFNGEGIRIQGGNIVNSRIVQSGTAIDPLGSPTNITSCVVDSNSTGINNASGTFLHCTFNHNITGMTQNGALTVDSCTVNYNQTGIAYAIGANIKNSVIDFNSGVGVDAVWSGDYIYNCEINNNGIGIYDFRMGNFTYPHNTITKNIIENDSIGIKLDMDGENIYCNRICNNTAYGVKYTATNNSSVANNYWCTNDSASTEVVIYDAHDNVGSGILTIMPLDTVQCYLVTQVVTGIAAGEPQNFSFSIFPNPTSGNLTITLPTDISNTEIRIFNMLGELEYASTTNRNSTEIDVSNFARGLYVIQVGMGNKIVREKFVKQ